MMKYLEIIMKVLIVASLVFIATLSYQTASESEVIFDRFKPTYNSLAQYQCYNSYPEPLKIELNKLETRIVFHNIKSYDRANIVVWTSAVLSIFILLSITRGLRRN